MKNPDVTTFELYRKGEPRIFEKDGEMFYEQNTFDFTSIVINLTRSFGKGNEPKTIEEFNKHFPRAMYIND